MERLRVDPRPDHGRRLEEQGLSFHAWDDYWKEDVCYRFTAGKSTPSKPPPPSCTRCA